jgi:enamine deaminase RidA (YjgF/YER057c/UK114 family)
MCGTMDPVTSTGMTRPLKKGRCMQVLQPKHWTKPKGFSNGVAAQGRLVFVAGQIGWNAAQQFESDDFVAQVEQALRNIVEVLAEADAGPQHLVRLTWYVTDKREYLARSSEVGQVYRRVIGRHFPAMALVQVVALVEDRAKVEIEATAVVPTAPENPG